MSNDNFIARWSRRKRAAESEKGRPKEPEQPTASAQQQPAPTAAPVQGEVEPPFDPATLPPIESIVADTDIRAFLQKGVPAELTKAALRRAWATDPAIRDFIEIAENQWDFTNPSSIPGFGPLRASDDVRQLAAQAMGQISEPLQEQAGLEGQKPEESRPSATATAQNPSTPSAAADAAAAGPSETNRPDDRDAMAGAAVHPEPTPVSDPVPRRKGHGAAMPR